jgi:diaminopimelate epimerase
MAKIPFVKAEGLGNDFLVVDLRPGRPAAGMNEVMEPEVVRALCDRHFGVGGDGVLAILPGELGHARMRVLNADGSEAEMCGNGIRCVAKVLYDMDAALCRPLLRIDTGAGLLSCKIDSTDGKAETVTVEMGRPTLDPPSIPVAAPSGKKLVRHPLTVGGREFVLTPVSMGNPHAVIFIDDPTADLRGMAESLGRGIEHDGFFPRRTNVEFARVRQGAAGTEIDVVVWERGCGITLACGTGACATAVAACLEKRAVSGQEIPVHLPGGTLFIRVASPVDLGSTDFPGVSMRGPAQIVFEAAVDPARIRRP